MSYTQGNPVQIESSTIHDRTGQSGTDSKIEELSEELSQGRKRIYGLSATEDL